MENYLIFCKGIGIIGEGTTEASAWMDAMGPRPYTEWVDDHSRFCICIKELSLQERIAKG
jgi:hypothetical protein